MEYTENKLTKRVENPKPENKLEHRTTKDGNLNSHEASYKTDDSGKKARHKRTPLERKPIFQKLVKAKREKIGKESDYNDGQITENRLKKCKPCQLAQPLFDDDFKDTKPDEYAENRKNKRKSGENRKNSG